MNTSKKIFVLFLIVFSQTFVFAQIDSTKAKIEFFGGVDIYYTYDFNEPSSRVRPGFFYSHTRHNGININTAYLGAKYENDFVRGNFTLIAGDYSVSNYAVEEQLFQNIFEANAGVRLAENLWLDAGIFGSHIGLEGAIGPDNPTLTRSLIAHNSPFFESGVKLSYQLNEEWFLSLLVLNGWQNIRDNNDNKAIGTQITYTPYSWLTINSSTYFGEGNNAPSSIESNRYFHNLNVLWQANERIYTAFAFEIGGDKLVSRGTDEYANWWGTAVILNYELSEQWKATARLEHFNDPDRVIIDIFPLEHRVTGISLGADYSPVKNAIIRFEGKWLTASEDIFERESENVTEASQSNFAITTSLGISF